MCCWELLTAASLSDHYSENSGSAHIKDQRFSETESTCLQQEVLFVELVFDK